MLADKLYGTVEERTTHHADVVWKLQGRIANGRVERVTLRGEAGTLAGIYYRAEAKCATGKVVLFLSDAHATAATHSIEVASRYSHRGVSVLVVDYRGFGASQGVPTEEGLYRDAEAMLDHLVDHRRFLPKEIVVHGYGLGAVVAARLTGSAQRMNHRLRGIVLDHPRSAVSKAALAYEVRLARLAGPASHKTLGSFCLREHMEALSRDIRVMLIADKDPAGGHGESLRKHLLARGFVVSGDGMVFDPRDGPKVIEYRVGEICREFIARAVC